MTGALLAYAAVQAPAIAARSSSLRLLILAAGSVPTVLLYAPLLRQMSTLFTFQRSLLLVLTLALMLGLGSVPLAALRRRFVSPLLLLVCAASLAAAAGATPELPIAEGQITYLKDATSWKSWWLMPSDPLDERARPVYAEGQLQTITGMGNRPQWVAPAPASVLQFPELRALRDEVQDGRRKVVFSVSSRNNSPTIEVRVEGTPTLRATLDGALLTARASSAWSATLHGTAGLVHRFELELVPGNTARVFVQERRPGTLEGASGTSRARPGIMIAADMLVFR